MLTELEKALDAKLIPWTEIEYRTRSFWVFRDVFSSSQRRLLFVPTEKKFENLVECYKAAYKFGYDGVSSEKWSGFDIVQQCRPADQSITYPYVYMTPWQGTQSDNKSIEGS